jgi:hypothetical protein
MSDFYMDAYIPLKNLPSKKAVNQDPQDQVVYWFHCQLSDFVEGIVHSWNIEEKVQDIFQLSQAVCSSEAAFQ